MMVLITAVISFTACKKEFNAFYQRPDTLEKPIYQQLEAKGNFTQIINIDWPYFKVGSVDFTIQLLKV